VEELKARCVDDELVSSAIRSVSVTVIVSVQLLTKDKKTENTDKS